MILVTQVIRKRKSSNRMITLRGVKQEPWTRIRQR